MSALYTTKVLDKTVFVALYHILQVLFSIATLWWFGIPANTVIAQDSIQIQTSDTLHLKQTPRDTLFVEESQVRGEDTHSVKRSETELQMPVFTPQYRSFRGFCNTLSMPWTTLAAVFLPGSGQVINGDYWKLPLVWGSIAGFVVGSIYFDRRYSQALQTPLADDPRTRIVQESDRITLFSLRNGFIVASAVSYSLGVADAMFSHSKGYKSPLAALVSSALLPGLGQFYTETYWKIPIIYGAAVVLSSQFVRMNQLYRRFDKALTYMLDENPETIDEFEGKRSRQDIEYFRDYYRRNRDLNLLGLSLLYILNVIDAYVGAHLYYWNIDNNLAMRIYPSLSPQLGRVPSSALSMNFNLSF
ncbi:MAG: DUF5683 domain-containing protein [Bacteroides sp.]